MFFGGSIVPLLKSAPDRSESQTKRLKAVFSAIGDAQQPVVGQAVELQMLRRQVVTCILPRSPATKGRDCLASPELCDGESKLPRRSRREVV